MKIFVSWSGERSHAVARVLYEWVTAVIQAARPWLSSEDIQRGAQWGPDIGAQLQESSVGIFCLTQKNKTAPWILFEAGAIAKGVPANRICTLLIDLEPSHVVGPLSQFNHTKPTREDMYKLAVTLNAALGESRLDAAQLKKSFDAHWSAFEHDFQLAIDSHPEGGEPAVPPDSNEMLGEILASLRGLSSRMSQLELNQMRAPSARDQINAANYLRHASSKTGVSHETAAKIAHLLFNIRTPDPLGDKPASEDGDPVAG